MKTHKWFVLLTVVAATLLFGFQNCASDLGPDNGGGTRLTVANGEPTVITTSSTPSPSPTAGPTAAPTAAPLTYAWAAGGFNACNYSCGGGSQSRNVSCVASNGAVANEVNCGGGKPATTQNCNTQACGLPGGSYGLSCYNCAVSRDELSCICNDFTGLGHGTSLSNWQRCVGDIGNDNARLSCPM